MRRGDLPEKCLADRAVAVDLYASVFTLYGKLPNLVKHIFSLHKIINSPRNHVVALSKRNIQCEAHYILLSLLCELSPSTNVFLTCS